ncbi:outer membrane lipoprotein chaperone LolA, partial [Salmonella enterica subsp. enterica serovar Kentucky]|nr:outer membrane lipoprotein chaperone LolA [Salmonella enterica subsp. enterica serovar Kentucky]
LMVWAAGIKAPDFMKEIGGLETNRINQLVVEPTLQTTRDPDILKKMAIACALLSSVVASSVWADAASSLKSRLDKVSSFHATFTQK